MRYVLAFVLSALLVATPAYADVGKVTYDRVKIGWSRQHVQRAFADTGHRVLMWADSHHRHLVKTYAATRGRTIRITFKGPLITAPFAGPYHVEAKENVVSLACPECKATDADIMGYEVQGVYDGVLYWQCMKCGLAWTRDIFDKGSYRAETARVMVDDINQRARSES